MECRGWAQTDLSRRRKGDAQNVAIATKLHLSVSTVETHRAPIKEKLSLPNAMELVRRAVEWVNRQQWRTSGLGRASRRPNRRQASSMRFSGRNPILQHCGGAAIERV